MACTIRQVRLDKMVAVVLFGLNDSENPAKRLHRRLSACVLSFLRALHELYKIIG